MPNVLSPPASDIAVVHLTFEGFQIWGGGVCTVTRENMKALGRLRNNFAGHGITITPYAAEIAYSSAHPRWVPGGLERGREQLRSMGGELFTLPNYSDGNEPRAPWGVPELGGMENWKTVSGAATGLLFELARRHKAVIAYCNEAPYALTSVYAGAQSASVGLDITTLYVSHANALLHEMPVPNPERLMVECAAVQWAKIKPFARLGVISDFMRAEIKREYGAADHTLVPTGNGVDPTDPWYRRRSTHELEQRLKAEGVPLDKPLIVSFGRNADYKRHDLVIRAAAEIGDEAHLVLMNDFRRDDLHALNAAVGANATLITSFDKELVASLVQWPETRAAVLYSDNEPCGIMPMEVRLLARGADTLLVLSDSGGFREQASHGVDAILGRPADASAAADAIRQVLRMSPKDKVAMNQASLHRVLNDFTWTDQVLRTLVTLRPELAEAAEKVSAVIHEENLQIVGSLN